MGRKPIDPKKRKKTVSYTLTDKQKALCAWTAKQLNISASELVGILIEKEAKRVYSIRKSPLPAKIKNKLIVF